MLVCKRCKGKNIETKVWADANDSIVLDSCTNGLSEEEDNWCRDCEDHVEFKYVEDIK
jgi:hypothetical protein